MFNPKRNLLLVAVIIILGAFCHGCNVSIGYETDQANKLVDEANVAIKAANDKINGAVTKIGAMETAVDQIQGDSDLEQARTQAKSILADLKDAKAGFNTASTKFGDASKLKLKPAFKDYLDTKSKEMAKREELADAISGEPQALIDTQSKGDFVTKMKDVNAKADAAKTAADDLSAKADKLVADNKDIFKSDSK